VSEGLIRETSLRASASPPSRAEAGARRLAVLLAWIAGGVDAIGYLALAHLFTAHMSGNTVALGASVGTGETAELARRGVAILLFAAGIGLGTALGEVRRERGGRHPTVAVLGAELILLLAFVVIGERQQIPSPDDPRFYVMVAFPTVAMGLQSATLRRIGDLHVRTTYISGVLTNLMEAIVHRLFGREKDNGLDVKVYGAVWGSYLLGAILGGVGYARAGPLGMLLPIIGLGLACALDLRHPHEVAVEAT
jgi:uncharacterized membrane protein YoaK (UPF0700 family)